MLLAVVAVILGLLLLIWSADRFVEGAAATALLLGVQPLVIGMLVVGFGTSAPELTVSAISAFQGNPGIALGNAYGSNIANIALILGATALLGGVRGGRAVVLRELPIQMGVLLIAGWQLLDGELSRGNAVVLLVVFAAVMIFSLWQGRHDQAAVPQEGRKVSKLGARGALWRLVLGLVLLVVSSRMLVYGAVVLAQRFGISDLVIGLTIVAVGTSLPELASSVAAARRGEHDLAIGNVVGSNLFNTLAVVGLAGSIAPMTVDSMVYRRDIPVTLGLTLFLLIKGLISRGNAESVSLNLKRYHGAILLVLYIIYQIMVVLMAR